MEDQREKKLCIHERDFIPGHAIAENIANCIRKSRRIILVITKQYTESAWCQYEVQVALAQIHQQRRGKLLIPILLEVRNNSFYIGQFTTLNQRYDFICFLTRTLCSEILLEKVQILNKFKQRLKKCPP